MRREPRGRVQAVATAAMLALAALGAGCGSDGEAAEEPVEQVSTTRRSNNDNACEQLRLVDGIKDRTDELAAQLVGTVRAGHAETAVLQAANQLATHLSDTAPAVAEAYTEAAAWAPAAAAAAIEELAAAYAAGVSGLVDLLGSDSADGISTLIVPLGAAAGVPPEEIEAGAAEEVEHYISVICGIT